MTTKDLTTQALPSFRAWQDKTTRHLAYDYGVTVAEMVECRDNLRDIKDWILLYAENDTAIPKRQLSALATDLHTYLKGYLIHEAPRAWAGIVYPSLAVPFQQ